MAEFVGLSRNLKLSQMNFAAELSKENLSETEYKVRLNKFLSAEIKSPTNLRKTREILARIWFYDCDDFIKKLRERAIKLLDDCPNDAVAIHWCMLLAIYPIFADIAEIIGKLSEIDEKFTLGKLKEKLYDLHGERTTLDHTTDKIISTMKNFRIIATKKPGRYKLCKHSINGEKFSEFMISAAITAEKKSAVRISELNNFFTLCPFNYEVDKKSLLESHEFKITFLGDEPAVFFPRISKY